MGVRSHVDWMALIGQIHGRFAVAAHRWLRHRRSCSAGVGAAGRRAASRHAAACRHTGSPDKDIPREACSHARRRMNLSAVWIFVRDRPAPTDVKWHAAGS